MLHIAHFIQSKMSIKISIGKRCVDTRKDEHIFFKKCIEIAFQSHVIFDVDCVITGDEHLNICYCGVNDLISLMLSVGC